MTPQSVARVREVLAEASRWTVQVNRLDDTVAVLREAIASRKTASEREASGADIRSGQGASATAARRIGGSPRNAREFRLAAEVWHNIQRGSPAGAGIIMGAVARGAVLAVIGLTLPAVLGGCAIGGPTGQERADELANQLEKSELGVHSAEATYLTSFSGDLSVSVVLSSDSVQPGYTVAADTLGPILGIVARSAEEMGVPAVVFYAEEEGGIDVSMVRATDDLGIAEALDGRALLLTSQRLEVLAKQR